MTKDELDRLQVELAALEEDPERMRGAVDMLYAAIDVLDRAGEGMPGDFFDDRVTRLVNEVQRLRAVANAAEALLAAHRPALPTPVVDAVPEEQLWGALREALAALETDDG